MSEHYEKGLLTGVVLGGLIGAGLAFFLTPKNGAENRKMVAKKATEIKGEAQEKILALKEQVKETHDNVKETVLAIFGEVSEVTLNLYTDANKLMSKQLATLKESVEDIDHDKYAKLVKNISETLKKNRRYQDRQIAKVEKYLLARFS
jgi:gas vesicle protein